MLYIYELQILYTRVTVDLEDAFNNFRNLGKLSSFGDEILWSDGTSWRRKGNNYFLFINNDDDENF